MEKFRFKLQKLLDIKIKDEEESKLKYTQAKNKKLVVEKELENLELSYKKYSNVSDFSDISAQKIRVNYLSVIGQSIKLTLKELEMEEKKVQEAKMDLIQKQVDRKSLEKLKENKLEKLRKEEVRKEQIANDEFALYAFMRRNA